MDAKSPLKSKSVVLAALVRALMVNEKLAALKMLQMFAGTPTKAFLIYHGLDFAAK